MTITREELMSIVVYVPVTGKFYWRGRPLNDWYWNQKYAYAEAGIKNKGYICITIHQRKYLAHRLAFLYMTGRWPTPMCDHIDTDGLNNKWDNLREATFKENSRNTKTSRVSTTGFKGVSLNRGRFRALIKVDGRQKYLGSFDTAEAAHEAYARAALTFYGEFGRAA